MATAAYATKGIRVPGEGIVRLYLDGERELPPRERCVAVVGARSCSPKGATYAYTLARELSIAGLTVVSGLARGIDSSAHQGALEGLDQFGEGGSTIAVLPCGIDTIYPRANERLAERIREHGLLVSEYEPGREPAPWRFPARNRIIAALSAHMIVVEAREQSGSIISAGFADAYRATLWAVPGPPWHSLSAGTNALIRDSGARMVPDRIDDLVAAIAKEAF